MNGVIKGAKHWASNSGIAALHCLALAMNIANCVGVLQGAFDVLPAYTGDRVVGGKPIREHLSTQIRPYIKTVSL
jgi:alkylation response protein AidB-like acyl-CoA dehydrogenase